MAARGARLRRRALLAEIPDIDPELLENLQFHCAFTHTAVNDASIKYLEEDRRYNYTTPKSYLELISLYKDMLAAKRAELKQAKERLETASTRSRRPRRRLRICR